VPSREESQRRHENGTRSQSSKDISLGADGGRRAKSALSSSPFRKGGGKGGSPTTSGLRAGKKLFDGRGETELIQVLVSPRPGDTQFRGGRGVVGEKGDADRFRKNQSQPTKNFRFGWGDERFNRLTSKLKKDEREVREGACDGLLYRRKYPMDTMEP